MLYLLPNLYVPLFASVVIAPVTANFPAADNGSLNTKSRVPAAAIDTSTVSSPSFITVGAVLSETI